MNMLRFEYGTSSLIKQDALLQKACNVNTVMRRIKRSLTEGYASEYASLLMPNDPTVYKDTLAVVESKRALNISTMVIIGIGGSNLGTIAIQEALYGTMYNAKCPPITVYYADTVDSDYITDLVALVESQLQQGKRILLNVVTKSGTTTETIANFEIFLKLLKHYHPKDFANYIVATTDRASCLWNIAQRNNFARLEIPLHVGGRYSVFSPVGLFPLMFMGVPVNDLRAGAQSMVDACLQEGSANNINIAAVSATLLYEHYRKGCIIQDFFVFDRSLYSCGMWYRQLVAESLGKELNTRGQPVHTGITPTVSIGSTDLHSVGQLYLGGPYDKFTTFVSLDHTRTKLTVPSYNEFEQCVPSLQEKRLSTIMQAILHGTERAFVEGKRPFCSVTLPDRSAASIGQLLQWKMIEVLFLGHLLDVNALDQPHVELYKRETRKILANA